MNADPNYHLHPYGQHQQYGHAHFSSAEPHQHVSALRPNYIDGQKATSFAYIKRTTARETDDSPASA